MDAVLVKTFDIDKDISLTSAASGIGNPLTVVGMTHTNEHTKRKKGMIHSGAGSALRSMLNKRSQALGIPLLNIVKREEQAEFLKK